MIAPALMPTLSLVTLAEVRLLETQLQHPEVDGTARLEVGLPTPHRA